MGLCQLQKLRDMGGAEEQIATVVEITRHIRDEAAQKVDAAFDEQSATVKKSFTVVAAPTGACCSTMPFGKSCC